MLFVINTVCAELTIIDTAIIMNVKLLLQLVDPEIHIDMKVQFDNNVFAQAFIIMFLQI